MRNMLLAATALALLPFTSFAAQPQISGSVGMQFSAHFDTATSMTVYQNNGSSIYDQYGPGTEYLGWVIGGVSVNYQGENFNSAQNSMSFTPQFDINHADYYDAQTGQYDLGRLWGKVITTQGEIDIWPVNPYPLVITTVNGPDGKPTYNVHLTMRIVMKSPANAYSSGGFTSTTGHFTCDFVGSSTLPGWPGYTASTFVPCTNGMLESDFQ